jgi:hypothetical protein
MIRMRMIKPQQFLTQPGRFLFDEFIVRWPDQESAPRAFFGRVRERRNVVDHSVEADHRAATLVWIRFYAMTPDRVGNTWHEPQ